MTRSPLRRTLAFVALTLGLPVVLVGCPKKPPPVADAAPPPPPASTTVTDLAPMDDGGDEADAPDGDGGKHWGGGGGGGPNAKVLQCCNALAAQAKKLGNSPEAFQLNALAQQCTVAAKGNAPEFAGLFAAIRSKNVPGCQALP
jgi:hypothetical protein